MNEDLEAMKQAYDDTPSQDNEGYVPDRGGFKSGWFAALAWERERVKQLDFETAYGKGLDIIAAKHELHRKLETDTELRERIRSSLALRKGSQ